MKHQNQLCRQIKEALMLAVPADLLLDLIDVVPGNSSTHYIVIFKPTDVEFDIRDGYDQLSLLRDEFRDEISAAIHRRRVPNLTFKISPKIDWSKIRAS
jgi:hypothetical protein